MRAGVEAKQCLGPDRAKTFVLVRSIERREKERAMHDHFRKRIEASLARLERRIQKSDLSIRPIWHQLEPRVNTT